MGNILAGGIVLLLVFLAVRKMAVDKKRGAKCSGGCGGCSSSAACHQKIAPKTFQ